MTISEQLSNLFGIFLIIFFIFCICGKDYILNFLKMYFTFLMYFATSNISIYFYVYPGSGSPTNYPTWNPQKAEISEWKDRCCRVHKLLAAEGQSDFSLQLSLWYPQRHFVAGVLCIWSPVKGVKLGRKHFTPAAGSLPVRMKSPFHRAPQALPEAVWTVQEILLNLNMQLPTIRNKIKK